VIPPGQLDRMIDDLENGQLHGVSARTVVEGHDYVSRGLNAWRRGRFVPGPAEIIGTPTLFRGDLIREHPYDSSRVFSDDSELCERWTNLFGARFAISEAYVVEVGKASWEEVRIRCRMYGTSDAEIFRRGRLQGWPLSRQARSLLHPLTADFVTPLTRLSRGQAWIATPFLAAFTAARYAYWVLEATNGRD